MSLKDDIIFLGLGLTLGVFGPMLAGYVGVTLPWSTNVMFPSISFNQMTSATAAAMQAEEYAYAARTSPGAIGRTSVIVPQRGRVVSSDSGNTLGYSGDLRASPPGAFQRLSHPGLTGTTVRYVRS